MLSCGGLMTQEKRLITLKLLKVFALSEKSSTFADDNQ
jgi:hypothetical protein